MPKTCDFCGKTVPVALLLSDLGEHALRSARTLKLRPKMPLSPTSHLCPSCFQTLAHSTIHELFAEDQEDYLRLQDRALVELDDYEHKELDWYKQFNHKRSLGERLADKVAEVGGSWSFIVGMFAMIGLWAALNRSLPTGAQWDPYPYILLNLLLSMLASLQAPIIMMSQNRSDAIDREQAEYVGRFVLRSENSIRHVNAKVENLINNQWKRLLEIQELQSALIRVAGLTSQQHLQTAPQQQQQPDSSILQSPDPMTTLASNASARIAPFNLESDPHLVFLMRCYFNLLHQDEVLVFSHRHVDRDNFYATISNVQIKYTTTLPDAKQQQQAAVQPDAIGQVLLTRRFSMYANRASIDSGGGRSDTDDTIISTECGIKSVKYCMSFSDPKVCLDDLFTGSANHITLRDNFDMPYLDMTSGRITKFKVLWETKPNNSSDDDEKWHGPFVVGKNLPMKYSATFRIQRSAAVSEFWKRSIKQVEITYAAGEMLCMISESVLEHSIARKSDAGEHVAKAVADLDRGKLDTVELYIRKFNLTPMDGDELKESDALEQSVKEVVSRDLSQWTRAIRYTWKEDEESAIVVLDTAAFEKIKDENNNIYVFYCTDGRATVHL